MKPESTKPKNIYGAKRALELVSLNNGNFARIVGSAERDARKCFNYTPEQIKDYICNHLTIDDLDRTVSDKNGLNQEHHHFIGRRKKVNGEIVYTKMVLAIPVQDAEYVTITSFKKK